MLPPSPPRREPAPEPATRIWRAAALGVVSAALFGVLLFRLWALQVLHSDQYVAQAVQNNVRLIEQPAPRGTIFDRSGKPIVTNAASLALQVNASDMPQGASCERAPRPSACARRAGQVLTVVRPVAPCLRFAHQLPCDELRRLAWVLRLRDRTVFAAFDKGVAIDPTQPITIDASVTRAEFAYVRERATRFPGVTFQQTYERQYPLGAVGANVLGSVGSITESELHDPNFRGLKAPTTVGQTGVEYTYDRYLRGVEGKVQQSYDASGHPVGPTYEVSAPVPGNNLYLSLDAHLEQVAQQAIAYGIHVAHGDGEYDANAGAIVAMNPRTGAVYALASYPTYSPTIFVPPNKGYERVIRQTKNPPLVDRSITAAFPPGSTFKPVTATAAWKSGLLYPGRSLLCSPSYKHPGDTSGTVFSNWDTNIDRFITLPTALEISCDTFFYRLGDEFYARGGNAFQRWIRKLGFGAPPPIDLPGATAGVVPDPHWKATTFADQSARDPVAGMWLPGDDITMAIGQDYLQLSPLQLATAYSAIANGGKVVTPHVAMRADQGGKSVRFAPKPRRNLDLPPDLVSEIRQGLVAASHSASGTSSAVFGSFHPTVAGKTGTAEVPPHSPDAWYAGWAPADDPKLVVVAFIQYGGHGGVAAAPAALRVFQAFFHPHEKLATVVGHDQSR